MKLKLTFKSAEFEQKDGAGKALRLFECIELPEIAVVDSRERFLWKRRYIVRRNDTEFELPSLLDAVVLALQQNGIPKEMMDEELKKYLKGEAG